MKGQDAFLHAAADDPLFAAEGMDLERAEQALRNIEAVVAEIQAVCARESLGARIFLWVFPLSRYAVPLPFIKAFLASEESRRAYLAEPSRERALHLAAQWQKTAAVLAA